MAYPNPIKTTGALSQENDIFEYFKGALADLNSTYTEIWPTWQPLTGGIPDYFLYSWGYASPTNPSGKISFPMTRQQFYNWIDYWTVTTSSVDVYVNFVHNNFRTIHGTKLYQFAEPQGNTNWPVEAVIHWGKIKTLELAIFGSVGNGGSLTTNSIFTSGTLESRVPEFKICHLSYLRYALARFDTYGSCHPEIVIPDNLTYVSESTSPRQMRFSMPSGILAGDCEYSLNAGGSWDALTGVSISGGIVTWPVPSGQYQAGEIFIRVRKSRGAYLEAGVPIYNQFYFP